MRALRALELAMTLNSDLTPSRSLLRNLGRLSSFQYIYIYIYIYTGLAVNGVFLFVLFCCSFCFVFGGPGGGFGGPGGGFKTDRSSGKATTATGPGKNTPRTTKTTARTTENNTKRKTKRKTLFSSFLGHNSDTRARIWTKLGGNVSQESPGAF